jgi:hypothetical protein
MTDQKFDATGPTAQVDPAKGNALLKRLFSSRFPIVPDPQPAVEPSPKPQRGPDRAEVL